MEKMLNIFRNIPENVVICLTENKTENLTNEIKKKSCYTIYCGYDWINHQKKIVNGTNICIDTCSNSNDYPFE